MVLLPGCVCCTPQQCVFPRLNSYSVEVNGLSSWDFRCGRPAGTTATPTNTTLGAYVYKSSYTSQCGLIGGMYIKQTNGVYSESYGLGPVDIDENAFRVSNPNTTTPSMFGATYGNANGFTSLGAFINLDLNYTTNAATGLMSWTFRAAATGSTGKRWRNVTAFYSQTAESLQCVNDSSLACCGDAVAFHLPTPTTFSFNNSGVTVDISGVSNTFYAWTTNNGSSASDFNGTLPAVIKKQTPCFQNCNYSTNLCCNPLP